MWRIVLFFSFFLIGILHVNGQNDKNIWSLKDCIQYALHNNLDLKKQDLSRQISNLNFRQSRNNLYPNLNLGAGRTWDFGDKFDIYTNTYQQNQSTNDNYSLSSSLVLFSGFQKLKTIKKNKYSLMASQEYYNKAKDDLTMNIATAYLNVLFSRERYASSKMQNEISILQMQKTKKLVEAGSLPEGNLLDVQAQAATDELNMINAQNNLDLAILSLTQLLDLPTTDNFEVKSPDFEPDDFPLPAGGVKAIINTAIGQRPEVKAAEWELRSSIENLKIVQGRRYPTLSLNGSLTSRYSDALQVPDMDSYTVNGTKPTAYFTEDGKRVLQYNYSYDSYTKAYQDQLKDNFYQ